MIFAMAFTIPQLTYIAHAQETIQEQINVSAEQQKANYERRKAELQKKEQKVLQVLKKSQDALALAERLDDVQAAQISRRAIAISERALANARAKIAIEDKRLKAVEDTLKLNPKTHVALASRIRGKVYKKTDKGWVSFDSNSPIAPGDEVKTGEGGFVELMFTDGSIINLDENTTFRAVKLDEKESIYEALKGHIRLQFECIKKRGEPCRQWKIRTPKAVIGPRGTDFQIDVRPDGRATIIVMDGVVEIRHREGGKVVEVKAGQKAVITKDGEVRHISPVDLRTIDRWWDEAFLRDGAV